jgi:hypothetical protein
MKPSGFSHRELPVRNGRRADVRLASPGAAGDEAFKKRLTPPFSIDCYGKCNYYMFHFIGKLVQPAGYCNPCSLPAEEKPPMFRLATNELKSCKTCTHFDVCNYKDEIVAAFANVAMTGYVESIYEFTAGICKFYGKKGEIQ